MNLKEWLKKNEWGINDFAEHIMCHRTYISAIINGRQSPSKRLAKAIEEATGGKVTASSLIRLKTKSKRS